MDETKLKKLEALFNLVHESITKEEFVKSFKIVVDMVNELRASNRREFDLMHQAVNNFSEQVRQDAVTEVDDLKKQVELIVGGQLETIRKKIEEVKDGKTPTKEELTSLILPLIPEVSDGEPGKDGSPDTGEEIIKKINKADSLISKDAVQGFKELEKAVEEKTGNTVRVGWGAHPLTVQSAGVAIDKNTRFINFVGAGITSVARTANGVVTVTIGGGGGSSVETPTGTVNGSNTTFTVSNEPKYIVVDGVTKFVTVHYTYSGGTLEITDGAPPVLFIRSIY